MTAQVFRSDPSTALLLALAAHGRNRGLCSLPACSPGRGGNLSPKSRLVGASPPGRPKAPRSGKPETGPTTTKGIHHATAAS